MIRHAVAVLIVALAWLSSPLLVVGLVAWLVTGQRAYVEIPLAFFVMIWVVAIIWPPGPSHRGGYE